MFCKFCGKSQEENIENKEKTKAPIGCLSVIIVIIISFILLAFYPSDETNNSTTTNSNNCPSYDELLQADNMYIKGGIVSKSVPALNSVYVTRQAQSTLKHDDYETMGFIYACLSSKVKGNNLVWSEIYDDVTHKKIAKYSNSYGFKLY